MKLFNYLTDDDQDKLVSVKASVVERLKEESRWADPKAEETIVRSVPDDLYLRRTKELESTLPELGSKWAQEKEMVKGMELIWAKIVSQERKWAADWFIRVQPKQKIGYGFYHSVVIVEIHQPLFFQIFGEEADEYWSRYETIMIETWKRILDVEGNYQPVQKHAKIIKLNKKRLRELGIEGEIDVNEAANTETLKITRLRTIQMENNGQSVAPKIDLQKFNGLLNRLKNKK